MVWLESLLDTLSDSGVCYSDTALTRELRASWLEVLNHHQFGNQFKMASVGRASSLDRNPAIRNDEISWLNWERVSDQKILEELNLWRLYLNRRLFLSTQTTEAHFALYGPGRFYKRHLDQHTSKASRILTFITYLHSDWKKDDGGELVITHGNTGNVKQIIEPLPGRVVIFKSDEVWHEVRKSNFTRSSLTGWFRYDADTFAPPASAI